jgi:hypothetical protein
MQEITSIVISYLIPTFLGGVIGWLTTKVKKARNEEEIKQKALEEGVQALLRNELIRRYREYEVKGEMSILDKGNIEEMFKQYQNLGGNGTVKELMNELLHLPTKIINE